MKVHLLIGGIVLGGLLCYSVHAENGVWPQWRGPRATGVASEGADPPVRWSEEQNVAWKRALPGLGHSSPVSAGQLLVVTAAEPIGGELPARFSGAPGAHDNVPVSRKHRFLAIGMDRSTGQIAWQTTINEALPHEGGHYTASLASASPLSDGERVVVYFGSYGLACLDTEGNILWKQDLGRMQTKHGHGEGSSPALQGDLVVVNWDHEGDSFIAAFDKHTGVERWRQPRDEVTSWASPLIVSHAGGHQVIVCGTSRVRAYELQSGRMLWECGGLSANIVATPVAADGIVIVGSSYEIRSMLAIKLDGAMGDLTGGDQVLWRRRDRTPYVPSPLLVDGHVYFLRHYQGILTRVDIRTGDEGAGPFRMGALRNIYASPVSAANRIYVTDLDGVTQVISTGQTPRVLAVNKLNDRFSASAAILDKTLFLRGREYLYALKDQAP